MKKPRLERGPKLNRAIAQPQTTITSGVRQLAAAGNRRRSPSVAVIQNSLILGADHGDPRVRVASNSARSKVNALAWKSQPRSRRAMPRCKLAGESCANLRIGGLSLRSYNDSAAASVLLARRFDKAGP